MSRAFAFVGLVPAALLTVGCMSVANHSPYFCPNEATRERVYGGVLLDVEGAGAALGAVARGEASRPLEVLEAFWISGVLLGIDLPLCAVADTLLLPRTIRVQQERRLAAPVPDQGSSSEESQQIGAATPVSEKP